MHNAAPRTFRGPTPRAALDAVKMAYGPDAIILATREIPGNVFRNREIEVLASPPSAEEQPKQDDPYAFLGDMADDNITPAPHTRAQKQRASSRAMAAFQANSGGTAQAAAAAPALKRQTQPLDPSFWQQHQEAIAPEEDLADESVTRVHVPTRNKVPSRRSKRKTLQIQKELERARQASPMGTAFAHGSFQPPEGAAVETDATAEMVSYIENQKSQMINRGMDNDLVEELLSDAKMLAGKKATPVDIQHNLERMVAKSLRVANAPWGLDPSGHRRVMALVGPTGVGKTTTAAKIAARALVEHHMSVALITVDTYRIGAIDQLAKYGELLGLPTYVARDRSTLLEALNHTRDKDLVIIDTAGRSPSDVQGMKLQSELLRSCPEVMLHLVVSASTPHRQVKRLESRYQTSAPERLIVTKLDEAEGNAALMNVAARISLPLSCVTNGQRVPEDLHWWNVPTIVEQVVGQ